MRSADRVFVADAHLAFHHKQVRDRSAETAQPIILDIIESEKAPVICQISLLFFTERADPYSGAEPPSCQ